MKTRIFLIIGLLLLYLCNISNNKVVAQDKSTTDNTLRIVCTQDFYSLTNNWVGEFYKLNPEVKIEVIKFTAANSANILNTKANLYFVSDETFARLGNKELWKMKAGRDALIPIMNSKNSFLQKIKNHNISSEILAQILRTPDERIWYKFPKTEKTKLINYYMVNDQLQNSRIAKFLSAKQNIEGVIVDNNEKLISAIQNDPYSIGFCKLSTLINLSNDKNITIVPIDISGNGEIDDFENVYTDLQTFLSNRWFGKFPNALSETIYSIATEAPTNQTELDFLQYISTNGQQSLDQMGYATLAYKEKQANLKKLGFSKDFVTASKDSTPFPLAPYIVAAFILLAIIAGFFLAPASESKTSAIKSTLSKGVLDANSVAVPTGLYFDKTHTWAFMEKGGLVGVGIDDFLQHVVGPITKIIMKEPGSKIKKSEPLVTIIQNGKQLTIKAPISGTIKSQNKKLLSDSTLLNNSPYDQGWVYMIEPTNWLVEIEFLIMWRKYNDWLKNEFTRLKDFLKDFVKFDTHEYAPVLQDGGELKDGVLADFGPEIWEEFQTNFIDVIE